jgi:CMP-N,N'-diacetyllegionaminic acid synthase
MNTASTIVIIPARSGSKSIKDKNIQKVGSKSLLQHSIDFAQELVGVDKVLVSTNSPVYASIARRHGAWVPFLRPEEISEDRSKDIEAMRHATNWIIENGFMDVGTVVWLRPSYPIRDSDFVNKELAKFKQDDSSCSLRSVRLASESPYKMWTLDQSNELHRVIGRLEDDLHNAPRQTLPEVYWQDGYIDFYNQCYIHGNSCHHQKKFSGALSPEISLIKDIDHKSDLVLIQDTLDAQDSLEFRSIEAAEEVKYSS